MLYPRWKLPTSNAERCLMMKIHVYTAYVNSGDQKVAPRGGDGNSIFDHLLLY